MRIGIVTYWTIKENYGQIMQMYALSTFFFETLWIRWLCRSHYRKIVGD